MLEGGKKFRTEQKYYLHLHDYLTLQQKVSAVLKLDKHSIDREGYNIRSLYFDDSRRRAMEEKNDGIFRREKYRIRIYNGQDSHITVERKSKFGDFVCKESAKITREQYDSILSGDYEFLYSSSEPLLKQFYVALQNNHFRPACIVDYWREAYIYEIGNVRITFDKKLAAGVNSLDLFHPDLVLTEALPTSLTILEVKFDTILPDFIRQLIVPKSHNRSTISKYVISHEKLLQHHAE